MCFIFVRVMKILDVMVIVCRLLRDGGKIGLYLMLFILKLLKFLFLMQFLLLSDRKFELLELLVCFMFLKIFFGLLSRLLFIYLLLLVIVICGVDDWLMFGDGLLILMVDVEFQWFINFVNLIVGFRYLCLGGVKFILVREMLVCFLKQIFFMFFKIGFGEGFNFGDDWILFNKLLCRFGFFFGCCFIL